MSEGRHANVIAGVCALALLLHGVSGAADAPPNPQAPAVDDVLHQSDVTGVWEKIDKNRVHHLQSGLVCDAMFYSMGGQDKSSFSAMALPLTSAAIVASDRPRGDDVACNYEAPNGPLVVIEAIHLKPHEDARDVFWATEKELGAKFASFHPVDEFPLPNFSMPITVEGELGQGVKYENYEAIFEGRKYLATIWAGPVRGWAVIVYAVGTSDNPMLQHIMVNVQWMQAARWVLATSISRGERAP